MGLHLPYVEVPLLNPSLTLLHPKPVALKPTVLKFTLLELIAPSSPASLCVVIPIPCTTGLG